MQYVGIHTQQVRNNIRSMLLLCCFPLLVVAMVWLFWVILSHDPNTDTFDLVAANALTLDCLPMVLGIVAAGAVVVEDVPAGVVVAGCPARIIKEKDERTASKTAIVDALRTL